MGKAIILSRVSTVKQDLAQQTDEVFKFAKADGYDESNIVLIEDKESAVKLDEEHRLGLTELKQHILKNPGMFDVVYAYEISRIGRRAEVNYSIRNFLQQNRVQLIILKPYIKLFDSEFKIDDTANMTFAIFNALAENEGYIRKERMMRGVLRKKQDGKYTGGRLPFGYTVDSNTREVVVDNQQANIVRKMFKMYVEEDRSTSYIAKYFNETGELNVCDGHATVQTAVNTICTMLKNKSYTGQPSVNRYTKKEVIFVYPRIVSDSLFDAAQEKFSKAKNAVRKSKHVHLCKGLVKDKDGNTMTAVMSANLYKVERSYFDGTDYKFYAPMTLIDSVVWHFVKQYRDTTSPAKVKEAIKQTKQQITILEKKIRNVMTKIEDCDTKERRINERIVSGKIKEDVGDAMLETNNQQKEQLLTSQVEWILEHQHLNDVLDRLQSGNNEDLSNVTDFEDIAKIIADCVKEITVESIIDKGIYELTITFDDYSFVMVRINSYKRKAWYSTTGEKFEFDYLQRTKLTVKDGVKKNVVIC